MLYPDGRLDRWDRVFVGWCLLTVPGAELTLAVLNLTYADVRVVLEPLNVTVIVFIVVIFVRRWRRAGYLERRSITPLLAAVIVAGAVTGVANDTLFGSRPEHFTAALAINSLAILLVPGALVHGTVRRRADYFKAVEAFGELAAAGASRAEVRDCLRTVLHDDALDIYFWDESSDRFVSSDGTARRTLSSDRLEIPIEDGDNRPIALIETNADVERHDDLRRAVTSAGGMALLTQARLRALHLRGEEARVAEQDRIQRDLHDRGQMNFAAVGLKLAAISERAKDDPALRYAVDDARRGLREAIGDLRTIVEGIRPPLLASHGLAPAIQDLALRIREHLPDLRTAVPEERFPVLVENVAFCVVNEGLANVLKHAPNASVEISVARSGSQLSVTVADKGPGGASMQPGCGLAGLRDRCRTIGGELTIDSDERGTRLLATLPCT